MQEIVQALVRRMEEDDKNGYTNTSQYVTESLRSDVDKVDAYLNSKHTSGSLDSLGREKPFFNITIAARNIWFRATDLDRKNVRVKATKKKHYILAFLATILLQEWMNKNNFGQVLNDWGLSLANYGSSVLKFLEQGGELIAKVVDWNHLVCDAVDFENNPKFEKLEMTPAQLKQNKLYNQDVVKQLLTVRETRKTSSGTQKDNKSEYITLYELHGKLPLSYLTDDEEDEDYVQQMHVITFVKGSGRGKWDDFTLYRGKEKDPYIITHLIKRDGYTLAGGAPKYLFENQWMVNHNEKRIKDHLDLTSKLFWQTSDGNFIGQNAFGAMETGDLLIHALNQPLTALNNKADITALLASGSSWKALGNEITGISEAMLGAAPKSGTAWRQTEALLQENHSLFELMTENKGLALEEMLRRFVIPYLKKKLDTTEEISAILAEHQITQLDQMYVPNQAIRNNNRKIIKRILSDEDTRDLTPEWQAMDTQMEAQSLQQGLNQQGNQRFISPSDIKTKTWKKALEGLEWEVICDITGEQKDTQSVMTTLNTALQVMVNPVFSQNKKAQFVVNKILEESGVISPLELSQFKEEQPMPVGVGGSTVAPIPNNVAVK